MVMSGPIPAGSPSVRASGRTITRLLMLDHRLLAQLAKKLLRLGLEFLTEYLLAGLPLLRGILLRLLALAQRKQLDALRGHLGRGQVADFGLVENIAQHGRQVRRALDDDVAHRDVA